jgi:phosphatidylinositol alpha-1,6-mannosyltransferase
VVSPRTLWVSNDFPPRPGGIEQFLVNLVSRQDPQATRVLTARWPGDAEYDRQHPWRTDRVARRPLLPTPVLARTVRRAAREHRAEVVVFGGAWPLAELAPRIGLPSLALTMGHEAGMTRVGMGRLVTRIADRVDAIGVLSQFTRRELAPSVGGRAKVVDVVPGVDVGLFRPDLDGHPIRARHGIPADAPLVVCVSRLVRRKGQDVLVEAWPRVLARVPGARLLLAGTGPLAAPLARRVRALGLERSVVLAGQISWADLPAYHAAADLFAMPCRTRNGGLDVEGLGIVYLEAQACGVPVVAGRSGGAPEAVLDGKTGLVVDGAVPAAVAQAVADLLDDPARRRAMGRAGRAFVEQRYAWPVVTRDLTATLQDLSSARVER